MITAPPSGAFRATFVAAVLYFLVGINLPFYAVWLEDVRTLSGAQIGLVLGLATLFRIISGALTGSWAETSGTRRVVLALGLVAGVGFGLQSLTVDYAAILILGLIGYNAAGAAMPLSDAVLLRTTKGRRILTFGLARAVGSSAFILANLVGGALISTFGADVIIHLLTGGGLALMLAALLLPEETRAEGPERITLSRSLTEGIGLFRDAPFRNMMIATVLVQAAHGYYYNFSSLTWIAQGLEAHVGALWATGVLAEVILLAFAARLFRGWSPFAILTLAIGGALVRWTVIGFAPPLPILYGLQTLHALTFAATFYATMVYVGAALPEEKVPVAVSLNASLGFGPALALTGVLSGFVYDRLIAISPIAASMGYWAMVPVILIAAGFLIAARRGERQRAEAVVTAPAPVS